MDIDSMVKSMMAAKRVPLDKLNQDKQILEWTRESYRELNSVLYDFRANKLQTKYGVSAAMNANKAVTTGNTDAVKAEALSTANGIEMKVSVTQLATAKTLETPGLGQGVPSSTSLAMLDGVDLSAMSEEDRVKYLEKGFDITINGVSFKDKDGKSLFNGLTSISTMVATINSNAQADVIASYDEITGKLKIASKSGGADGKVEVSTPAGSNSLVALFSKKTTVESKGLTTAITGDKTLADLQTMLNLEEDSKPSTYKFSINGKEFAVSSATKIDDLINEINTKAGANVTASFDGQKLKVEGNAGGEVKLAGDSYGLMKLFGGASSFTEGPDAIKQTVNGQNAIVSINGTPIENVRNNIVTMNGVQITLLSTTKDSVTGVDNPTIIKNESNPDKALESVKGFINDYNELIAKLNAKIDEAKYRDFRPLTDEQKKELKESEVDAWTKKAKSGLLKNNDIISTVLSEMRAVITAQLGPLSTMGITTGNYLENGKLVIQDEAKLKNALSANPQLAIDLFQGPENASNSGILDKLADKVSSALDKISERAGTNRFSMDLSSKFKEESVMGKKLRDYNSRILLMQRNLANTEDRYYRQFTAMETAMTKLNAQSSNLLSSLGIKQ